MTMKRLKISAGGQVSIPAEIRRRWGTLTVVIDDHGDEVVLRPAPDDPIAAARGRFATVGFTSDELRERARADDEAADARRRG
ncbi:MAG: AbrB/MazE/SpoVT family DNA-binding domain-containing protein [Nocardioides sp.]